MIPPFDIQGGPPLALARAASVAGLVGAAGSLAYARLLRPPALPAALEHRLRQLGLAALAAALAGALLWLAMQTQDMAGSLEPGALWSVLTATLFGRLVAARLVLLACAFLLLARRLLGAACLAACAALLLQAGHSHALAMGGSPLLLGSAIIHLLAAGLWLGSLPALLIVLAAAPANIAHQAATRFSRVGIACVLLLLGTAAIQFSQLVVSLPGLVGTAYGWMAGVKILLFAAMLALAARNRFALTPGLASGATNRQLRSAIALELMLGLAVLSAAGVLTELEPAMHIQKLWPFPWVPSLDAAREDPDIAREVIQAGIVLALSLAVLAGAVLFGRRRRWPALIAALAACSAGAAAAPHLSPLLVPALPTQFFVSPTGFGTGFIVQGAALYPTRCAACHGPNGHGDGPLAHTLAVPPADLTAPHLWMHSDGELFWWLTHGIEGPRGGLVMPGFPTLSDDDRWALIDFVRARNAGLTLGPEGRWATQLSAPDFPLSCPSGQTRLSALRGSILRVQIADATVLHGAVRCHAEDASLAQAYAVAAPGAGSVLIDGNGWLRAASPGEQAPDPALAETPLPLARPADAMPADMKM